MNRKSDINESNSSANIFVPSDRTIEIWDKVQTIQTDFCYPQEVASYYQLKGLVEKEGAVLDVGCGNGYFLGKISNVLKNKVYVGIDILDNLIEKAKANVVSNNIKFQVRNFFEIEESYDLIITRLFWQHLTSVEVEEAIARLEKIVNIGGSVIVMDAHDDRRVFYPSMPAFQKPTINHVECIYNYKPDSRSISFESFMSV